MKFDSVRHSLCRLGIPTIASFGFVLAVTGCATNSTGLQPAAPRAGDPALDGAVYLLSEPDFRAILIVARRRLSEVLPACTINAVTVISRDKVEAQFCGNDSGPYGSGSGTFTFERIRGEWKVVDQRGGKPPNNERVII